MKMSKKFEDVAEMSFLILAVAFVCFNINYLMVYLGLKFGYMLCNTFRNTMFGALGPATLGFSLFAAFGLHRSWKYIHGVFFEE